MSVKAQWNIQPEGFSLRKNVLWKSTLGFFLPKVIPQKVLSSTLQSSSAGF